MKETLHFSYKSIGNFVRLLVEIKFENTKSVRDISVFHARFDGEKDEVFEDFLIKLYPNGATIGEQEINKLVEYIANFMSKEKHSKDLYVEYDKKNFNSYVYFKIDNEVYYAEFCSHAKLVTDICCDYFKGFDHIDLDYLKMFIIENFEIKSDNTTLEMISNQADYIARKIICKHLFESEVNE